MYVCMYVCFRRSADNLSFISSQCNLLREDFNSAQKKLADDVEYLSGMVADVKNSSQQNLESIAKVTVDVYFIYGLCMYACMYVCYFFKFSFYFELNRLYTSNLSHSRAHRKSNRKRYSLWKSKPSDTGTDSTHTYKIA